MVKRAQELNPGLATVDWVVGDGRTLDAVPADDADVCFSSVVFQHVPDPEITLGYVAEVGRVLQVGDWAALQVSNDPHVHRPRPLGERLRARLRALLGRGPRGQRTAPGLAPPSTWTSCALAPRRPAWSSPGSMERALSTARSSLRAQTEDRLLDPAVEPVGAQAEPP